MDRPRAEIDAKQTLTRPPELCPDPYKDEVRLVLARHQVPWLVLFVMGKQGFVTAQDWAGQNGYAEHTCVLTAIRLENAVEQFKLLKKMKLAEVDIHSAEDYKAMIGRGVVADHPKDGELKFQKRQSKEDEEWIHEESNRDFYNFLFGDTIMNRVALSMAKDETLTISAAPKEIQNNSRLWSMEIDEFCLRRHHSFQPKGPKKGKGKGKDKDKGKVFQQWDYWKGKGKRPGKGKGDSFKYQGKSKKEDWRWAARPEEAAEQPPPPPATSFRAKASHHEWAPKGSDGKEFCKKYHAFNRVVEGRGAVSFLPPSGVVASSGPRFPTATGRAPASDKRALGESAQNGDDSWSTKAAITQVAPFLGDLVHRFDQCMLGCTHPNHPVWWSSSDLARWGWQSNLELATALLSFFSTSGDTDGWDTVLAHSGMVVESHSLRDTHLGDGCHRRGAASGQTSGLKASAKNWPNAFLPGSNDPFQPRCLLGSRLRWTSFQALVNWRRTRTGTSSITCMKAYLSELTAQRFRTRTYGHPSSAEVFEDTIEKTFMEELTVGWVTWLTSQKAPWLAEEKMTVLRPALSRLESGELHTRKEITSLLGKLQWVAKAYPQVSSHLQPLYAWEQKLERKCKPGDLVRFLATLLISILDAGPCVPLRLQRNTPCYGSSDAGEDDGRVAIGGWFSPSLNPTKAEVLWFSMDVLTTPWVQPFLAHTSPKRRIGALELLGTLILFLLAAESLGPSMVDAHLPLTTDNEGNAFSASKRSSKKWPCSALLMELSAQEFHKGVFAQVTHVKRSSNTWADQLTHFDFEGTVASGADYLCFVTVRLCGTFSLSGSREGWRISDRSSDLSELCLPRVPRSFDLICHFSDLVGFGEKVRVYTEGSLARAQAAGDQERLLEVACVLAERMSADALRDFLKSLQGHRFQEEQFQAMLQKVPADRDGMLNCSSVVSHLRDRASQEEAQRKERIEEMETALSSMASLQAQQEAQLAKAKQLFRTLLQDEKAEVTEKPIAETSVPPTTTTTSITTTRGRPPAISLREAAYEGDVAALTQHLQAGSDLNAADSDGWTAAHVAAYHGRVEVLKFLHQAGANLNVMTNYGATPAFMAANEWKAEALEALAKAGADLQKANRDGRTPTHAAAWNGRVDALRVLIQAGVDLNVQDNHGNTPADDAAKQDHPEALKLLLEAGGKRNKA
ncbi:Ankrd28 [Symbiodinium sp. CCMP2592]|nr:Ankrd28 [Symbiodinium sp. CCMP2592]